MGNQVEQLTLSTLFLALGLALPFAFRSLGPWAGTVFLSMHILVLLCGFVCGPAYGALVGILTPLPSSALTGMPPFIPTGIAMCLKLSTYGFLGEWMARKLPLYPSLIIAMLARRAVSELANLVLPNMARKAYAMQIFLTATFVTAIPGVVLQLVMILPLAGVVKKLEVRKIED